LPSPRAQGRTSRPKPSDAGTGRDSTNTETEDRHMNDEIKKPTNPRADVMPKHGFVLTVDGKMKASYETEPEATAAAVKLKQRFPVIQVAVYDAAAQTYTLLTESGS
jgi:hypothetical protein